MRRFALVLALALLAALALPLAATAQQPVSIVIKGPTALAPATTRAYAVTVTGGPAAEDGGEYVIEYSLQGDNLAGADPPIPATRSNPEGTFAINITTPEAEGTIVLFVKATSRGDVNESAEARYPIDVFRPIDLRITLRNNGAAAALNVTVYFYVDDRLVGNTTVARIDAGGEATANVSYIPVGLAVGRHTLRVQADLDGDGRYLVDRGELYATDFFYKAEHTTWPAIFGTVSVLLLVVLGFMLLAIRRQRRMGG
jgi:hypothetical protein